MTRDECIEAMAREMHDGPLGADDPYDELLRDGWNIEWINDMATAAYDAMADHIHAERERVRERCAKHLNKMAFAERNSFDGNYRTAHFFDQSADAIRALDIGGKTDG